MANPALYASAYQEQINVALMESARLSVPETPDITPADLQAKCTEIAAADSEMDDIAVDVLDSGEFVQILRLALSGSPEAVTQLQTVTRRVIAARAEYLLS